MQDGEPILKLLPKHIKMVTIDFSPDERDVSKVYLGVDVVNLPLLRVAVRRVREACPDPGQQVHQEQYPSEEVDAP